MKKTNKQELARNPGSPSKQLNVLFATHHRQDYAFGAKEIASACSKLNLPVVAAVPEGPQGLSHDLYHWADVHALPTWALGGANQALDNVMNKARNDNAVLLIAADSGNPFEVPNLETALTLSRGDTLSIVVSVDANQFKEVRMDAVWACNPDVCALQITGINPSDPYPFESDSVWTLLRPAQSKGGFPHTLDRIVRSFHRSIA